ncbi:MAG: FMN-binding protein [bacterium]|nr:FMN-binding protein [bacterium]
MRRTFATAALLAFSLSSPARADDAPSVYERVYLTLPQALRIALPAGDPVEPFTLLPTAEERHAIERRLGRRVPEDRFTVHVSRHDGRPSGYALVMDEQGKYYPITFIVGLKPDGHVREVAVMVYRERRGDAVQRRRFLDQFLDKSADDPLMVNRDLVHLTGATVSSWSIAAGVKKATVLFDALIRSREEVRP